MTKTEKMQWWIMKNGSGYNWWSKDTSVGQTAWIALWRKLEVNFVSITSKIYFGAPLLGKRYLGLSQSTALPVVVLPHKKDNWRGQESIKQQLSSKEMRQGG